MAQVQALGWTTAHRRRLGGHGASGAQYIWLVGGAWGHPSSRSDGAMTSLAGRGRRAGRQHVGRTDNIDLDSLGVGVGGMAYVNEGQKVSVGEDSTGTWWVCGNRWDG